MFERSDIDFAGFDAAFAAEAMVLGYQIPGRDVVALLAGEFRPEMIEALQRIKTRFKTRCIPNNMPADVAGRGMSGRPSVYFLAGQEPNALVMRDIQRRVFSTHALIQ